MIMKIKYFLLVLTFLFVITSVSALTVTYNSSAVFGQKSFFAMQCNGAGIQNNNPPTTFYPDCSGGSLTPITTDAGLLQLDSTYTGAINKAWQVFSFNATEFSQGLSKLNFTYYGLDSGNIGWIASIYIFNITANNWTLCSSDPGDVSNKQQCSYSASNATLQTFINSTGFINYAIAPSTAKKSTDFVKLEITYNSPATKPLLFTVNNSNFTSNFNLKWNNSTGGTSISNLFYHMLITNTGGSTVYENTTINETASPTNVSVFNFADGSYYWKVESNTSQGLLSGFNETFKFLIDSTPPTLNVIHPDIGDVFTYNQTIPINFSIFDNGVGLGTCYYQVDALSFVQLPNCLNATFNTTNGVHTINISVNDSLGNTKSIKNSFTVTLTNPGVVFNYPANNTWFNRRTNINLNWTATDSDGISICQIYNDINGSYSLNKTKVSISGIMDSWSYNISSDSTYNWIVGCNDTTTLYSFAYSNLSFGVDTVSPLVNILGITTTVGSQTISFNSSYTENNCNYINYSVYNASNGIDGTLNNVSTVLSCTNTNASITVSNYGTYKLEIYVVDKAGNINVTIQNFTTIATVPGGTTTGGGSTTIIINNENATWSMLTETLNDKYDLIMGKSISRSKVLLFRNLATSQVNLLLSCDNVNGEICQYVSFDNNNITLDATAYSEKTATFTINLPENITDGTYDFKIIAIDSQNTMQSISVRVSIGTLGIFSQIFAKIIGKTSFNLSWINDKLTNVQIYNVFFFILPFLILIPIFIMFIDVKNKYKGLVIVVIPIVISIIIYFLLD
jgi:hypothetical protein